MLERVNFIYAVSVKKVLLHKITYTESLEAVSSEFSSRVSDFRLSIIASVLAIPVKSRC